MHAKILDIVNIVYSLVSEKIKCVSKRKNTAI